MRACERNVGVVPPRALQASNPTKQRARGRGCHTNQNTGRTRPAEPFIRYWRSAARARRSLVTPCPRLFRSKFNRFCFFAAS